jgi:hypothetical protein
VKSRERQECRLRALSAADVSLTLRRLRAIALNGLVWGGAWFVGVMPMATVANAIDGYGFRIGGWELAVPGGILFAAAGVAFSTVITFALRGRRLSDLSWIRFGLGGGAVSFVFLPTFISVLRALNGDAMLGVTKLLGTGALGFVFGGIAAAGTLKLAQLADRYLPKGSTRAAELPDAREAPSASARDVHATADRTSR